MAGPRPQFGLDPATYDLFVNWPKRLAHETPFYRTQFERVGAQRVLDAACGTGHHAALFHSWGLGVEGADLSAAMIAHARALHGEADTLRWTVRSFTTPVEPAGRFDAVVCSGNSLALVPDRETVATAVKSLLGAVRPGGLLVIHVLNLWQIPEGPLTWRSCDTVPPGPRMVIKALHRAGDRGYISFADLRIADGTVERRFDSAVMLGLTAEDLTQAARACGGTELEFFGDYRGGAYERDRSQDLIMVCHRG